ncbi:tyrosine-type recombinase/integrase [Nocardia concava]|uniref:tyrosine-type recombinase/integrase n=1 Tax=Nocardia concava TaxID=257281 RepID=UPI00059421C8|nr:tyrosine-type recombinase/integrase [Nocardia concava]
MADSVSTPIGIKLSTDIEVLHRAKSGKPFRARVRWTDPHTGDRPSKSETFATEEQAQVWIDRLVRASARGLDPFQATASLLQYGTENMDLALRGLEGKTKDPYLCGWRKRVVPTLGHLSIPAITNGIVDRAVVEWIEEQGCGKSTIKNTLAVLVRVMEQARRDGLVDLNPARVRGWQSLYKQIEDELEDPRALAIPNWQALVELCDALVGASFEHYYGWGEVVMFTACTAARIGEVSGCLVGDIDTANWIWTVRRQTTSGPGGLIDKGTKGNRARYVPIIEQIRPMVAKRIAARGQKPDARLFIGPQGGRITTGGLRTRTHWDKVVTELGYDHLVRHTLRHTGLTWMADAGVPLHRLQQIAGHADSRVTERYIRPDHSRLNKAAKKLAKHLRSVA